MKKNIIALLLAVVMASGSIGSVPALAAETTAQEAAVVVEEETVEEAEDIPDEADSIEASDTTAQGAVVVEEETIDSEEASVEMKGDEAKEEIDESERTEDSSEAESVQAAEEATVSETEVVYENDSITEEVTSEDDIQQSETAVVPEGNVVKESKNAGMPFDGGSGTQEDPYKVSTAEQLNAVRDYPEAYFIQTTDINMSSINNWVPIGKESDQCFWGSYDGKGHTISNLKIKNDGSETYIGLFGYVGPEIKNLKLENTSIEIDLSLCSGPIQVGTLAGDAPVLNCSTHGTIIVTGSDSYGCDLGGIVGRAQGIENSNSDVAITVNCNGSKDMNIGGLAGECLHGSATNSYFKGSIKTSGDCVHIGGIIGITDWSGEVNNCVNYGNISVSNDSAGSTAAGVVAYPYDDSASAENCVNFGNIIGSDETFVAGITRADNSTVHNCYNLGNIEGNSYSGRIYTSDARNVNAYSNYGYENATVNGSIPTGGLFPSGFNGSDMSAENLRFVISDILEDCGCEWVEPSGESTEIDSNTIIYYTDGRHEENIGYSLDDCLTHSSMEYNPRLAYMLMGLATSAYQGEYPFSPLHPSGGGFRGGFPEDPLAITESLRNLGFSAEDIVEENYYSDAFDPNYGEDSTAFTIATKVSSSGERIITVVVRGSYGGFGQDGGFHVDWTQWASDWRGNTNFRNYNRGLHEGFSIAAEEINDRLEQFLSDKQIEKTDVKYVVTGHSRGAAVANIVSKNLIDGGISKEKVYNYNFACPDSGRDYDGEWNRDNQYGSMFNVNNVKDIVGVIPGALFLSSLNTTSYFTGFFDRLFSFDFNYKMLFWGKYGTTYFFAENWTLLDKTILGNPNTEHQPVLYLNYLSQKPSNSSFKSWTESRAMLAANASGITDLGKMLGIFCPVDTEIIDSRGNKVAEIINGEQKYYNDSFGHVVILSADDQCLIYLSGDDDYSVNMKGTDDGTLDFFVSDAISTDEGQTLAFENITLEQGKEINCDIYSEDEIEETVLYVVDEFGEQISKILPDGTEEPVSFIISGAEAWDGDEYGFNKRELNWIFERNGTLRIRYNGLTTDETYSLQNADNYSWKEYKNSVLELHVGKNISNLGKTSLDGYPKLRRLFFEYDPPTFMTDNSASSPLTGKTLEIHYPADNTAWNGVTGSNYGGNIKWEPCYSGVCGNDLTWVLDSKGTLVISGSGIMYNWTDETKTPWHEHVTDIKSIVIKNGVKNIGTAAFKKCTNVSDVRIGNTVTDIGNYAFYECGHLKTIIIPSKVTNIGDAAFALCSEINTITIPGNVSNIGKCAFEGCSGLKSVTIDEGVENIDKWAFNMCGNLLNVMIPASVTIIGDDAFANCSKDLIISGKGTSYAEKYAKEKGLTFIDPFNMDYAIVTGLTAKTYSGKAITQTLTVKIGSTTLTPNTDFTVSYKNNINAGTATVVITGKGNYTGTVTKTFTINKAAQSITAISSAATVSVGKTATVSTTGTKGNVTYSSSNAAIATVDSKTGKVTAKKVGTVTITAQSAATANYNVASKAVTVKVVPAATASLSAANLSTGIKLTWKKVAGANGYIIYRNGTKIKTITSGTTVTYSDTKANTNGKKYTYKVVAKATTGTSTLSRSRIMYRVARTAVSSLASRTAGKMTVKWKRNSKANGYVVQYSKNKSFSSGNKTATITKNTLINKTFGSLTKGKKYYVRVRCFKTVSGKKYYSAWSVVKAVTVKK